jgi:pilus assembly protein CpaF
MIPNAVFNETLLGFLAPVRQFMADPAVTEIIINGPDQVFIERNGQLEATSVRFKSREALLCALRNAAQFAGRLVDESNPLLEARLPDGSRLQAVLPPAALDGPHVAIRRYSERALSVPFLIETGSLSLAAVATLEACVRAKLNILIAGGTGSGKTSLLNLLTQFIPPRDRVIVLEESKEIKVQCPHAIYMEARPADADGENALSIRQLFRATLRLRPDRIVIGEMRGEEALDVIQAMVSGHGGCLGTVHATYPRDTLTRLETLALMAKMDLPLAALRLQIASGLNLIVQTARALDGRREVTHITEVTGFDVAEGRYELRDLFERRYASAEGRVASELVPTGALPSFLPELRRHGVDLPAAVYAAVRHAEESYVAAAE